MVVIVVRLQDRNGKRAWENIEGKSGRVEKLVTGLFAHGQFAHGLKVRVGVSFIFFRGQIVLSPSHIYPKLLKTLY